VPTTGGASHELTSATRDVLLGADPPVRLTGRALTVLARIREEMADTVHPDATLIVRGRGDGGHGDGGHGDVRWWTWAGYRANATLTATLAGIAGIADPLQRINETSVRLRYDLTPAMWREGIADTTERLCLPYVDARAVAGLKFSAALPERLATATLAARSADLVNAETTLRKPVRFVG
jgi:ATP-dependent Lhr-like helicase